MRKPKNYAPYEHSPVGTLKELLVHCTQLHGDKTAFMFRRKREDISVSFNTFKDEVDAFGTYLFEMDLRNSKIAVYGENSYEWILTHFAVTCGKNVIVPIDKDLDTREIVRILCDSECCAIVYSDLYSDVIAEVRELVSDGILFINMKTLPDCILKGREMIKNGNREYTDMHIGRTDLASVVYTSGTTGKSKGVMVTHGNFASDSYSACCHVSVSGPSILLLPLHHLFGLVAAVFSEMMYGYPIYINSSMKRILDDFQRAKPQNFFAVPLIVQTLYKQIFNTAKKQGRYKLLKSLIVISDALRKAGLDFRRVFFKSVISAFGGELELIVCGGAPLSPELIKAFDSFGITLLNGYGITECSPIVAVNRNKFNIAGSVGLPLDCNEIRIADDGEVLVRGENVMAGYYKNDTENSKAFIDDWFRTGDIGFIDEYGALHITGRIKNLIILSNGENISAESIEEMLYTVPYIKEAVVYGENDIIVAEVFLDTEYKNASQRLDDDIKRINRELPQIKNIGKTVIRETEFPKTTTKKIKRCI